MEFELVEAGAECKSYLWWYRNIACGDSTGSNQIEKTCFVYLQVLSGLPGEGWCDLVYVGRLLDD